MGSRSVEFCWVGQSLMQGLVDFRFLSLACLIIYLIIVGDGEEELSATVTRTVGQLTAIAD